MCFYLSDSNFSTLFQISQWYHIVFPQAFEGRKDLRDKCIVTIDPPTARDLDDAMSVEKLSNGLWEVGVHIADVSYFVPLGSELDACAAKRATSVYLVDKVRILPALLWFLALWNYNLEME